MQDCLEGWECRGNTKEQCPKPSETQMSQHLECSETGADTRPIMLGARVRLSARSGSNMTRNYRTPTPRQPNKMIASVCLSKGMMSLGLS